MPLRFRLSTLLVLATLLAAGLPLNAQTRRGLAEVLAENGDLHDEARRGQVVAEVRGIEDTRRNTARLEAAKRGLQERRVFPDGRVMQLVDWEDGRPRYLSTTNVNAAISTGANLLRPAPYSLTGSGVVIGLWDEGSARVSHQEFGGRVTVKDGAPTGDHATHVAGTMIASGVNASARGMASAATIDSYEWTNDLSEMTSRGMTLAGEAGRIQLSNHSYNYVAGWTYVPSGTVAWEWNGSGTTSTSIEDDFGRYNTSARDSDALAVSAPYYLMFRSAGNDRTDNPSDGQQVALSPGGTAVTYSAASHPGGDGTYRGGFDTVGFNAVAKNVITVGAVADAVAAGVRSPSAGTMLSFSSWGPTDDGRIKPDIVANGDFLFSSLGSSDAAYGYSSGTSMATPNACGSASLLIDLYGRLFSGQAMRSSQMKGLLIHTADDLGNAGPDYKYGWGLVNVKAAADLIQSLHDAPSKPSLIEDQLAAGVLTKSHAFLWDGVSPIRATLCWTDAAGTATSTAVDSRTVRLVNNLNLKVTGPAGAQHLPYVMPFVGTWTQASMDLPATTGTNNTDNVEQVYVAAPPAAGLYQAVVSVPAALASAQRYSLILSGSAPTPPTVTAVTPDSAVSGATTLTVSGNYFAPGAAVKLTRAGQPDAAVSVTTVTTTTITGSVNVTGLESGLWSVVVTNPDTLSGTLANGFAVIRTLWSQNFDPTAPGWSASANVGTSNWALVTTASHSPSSSWFASGPATKNTDNLTSEAISIPAGAQRVKLSFWHKYNLSSGNDGGVLEFSLDNAATWFSVTNTGTAEAITTGGYNVTMSNPGGSAANKNEFAGKPAWSGNSGTAFTQVIVSLLDTVKYGGTQLRARWRLGTNSTTASPGGWNVDTVSLSGAAPLPNQVPVIATAAAATPATVAGQTTQLSVAATDDGGEPALVYTWAVVSGPVGQAVSFSQNGNNQAKSSMATFAGAGSYSLRMTVQDAAGASATSTVVVTVQQTATGVAVSPSPVSVVYGAIQSFSAVVVDQFGASIAAPALAWSVNGGGTIDGTGHFAAQAAGGPFVITAQSGLAVGAGAVTVTKAPAVVTLGNLSRTYTGGPLQATVATTPGGLPVSVTYDGSAVFPVNAGSYAVVATVNDPNYTGTVSGTLEVGKAAATVVLGGLAQTYTGGARQATVVTTPGGLLVSVTYDGSAVFPVNAGSYAVVATVNDANYSGTASGTLEVGKAVATVVLGGLAQTYAGGARQATVETTPGGLPVSVTYDGSAIFPVNAGSYAVVATVNDANYSGTVTGTLEVGKAAATIVLLGLHQIYDGTAKQVTVETTPGGLPLTIAYDGSAAAPVEFGLYAVTVEISDPNYSGSAAGTLSITGLPLVDWRTFHFTTEQVSAGEAGDAADPDFDGLDNLAEYALGTDPQVYTPAMETHLDGTGLWLTLDRPKGLPDVVWLPESSEDLALWGALPLEMLADGPVQTVRIREPGGVAGSRWFLKVRFERP